MPDKIEVVETKTVTATPQPDAPESKLLWHQKRFWFALGGIVAAIALAWFNGARTPQDFAQSDGVASAVLTFLTVCGFVGVSASSWKGSKPTTLKPAEAKPVPQPPIVTATAETKTTTTTEAPSETKEP